jgi:DnaJ-class molecular chaperone
MERVQMAKEKCTTCRGKGKIRGTARSTASFGPRKVQTSDTCPDCGGTGYKRDKKA